MMATTPATTAKKPLVVLEPIPVKTTAPVPAGAPAGLGGVTTGGLGKDVPVGMAVDGMTRGVKSLPVAKGHPLHPQSSSNKNSVVVVKHSRMVLVRVKGPPLLKVTVVGSVTVIVTVPSETVVGPGQTRVKVSTIIMIVLVMTGKVWW